MSNKHPKREFVVYLDDSGLLEEREAQIIERNGAVVLLRDAETGNELHRIEQELLPIA